MHETSTLEIQADDPVLESEFAKQLIRQMRAIDTYGSYDKWSANKLLAPFILSKQIRREIPVIGDPDEITMSRVIAYYNALAAMIENNCGLIAIPMINLSHEGFGRAIITVGKLLVMDKTLRDIHRFGFNSLTQMQQQTEKIVAQATNLIEQYQAVAKL